MNSLNFPFAYQGQEKDAETNLINFELRQYDARLGRWYNPDPMGQHHSPYLAMSNNPVSRIDPNGGYDVNGGVNIDPTQGGDYLNVDNMQMNLSLEQGNSNAQWLENYLNSGPYHVAKNNYEKYVSSHTNARGQWGEWKTSCSKFDGPKDYFSVNSSFAKSNPFTGTSTISFFYTNDIVNRDDVMYDSYLKQKEFAKNDPRIDVVFVQNFSEAAKYLESKKDEGVSIQNVVFNAHGYLPNEKGTFNFGENPLREASDVDTKSFEKIGSLVNKNGIIVLLGCHTGGNNDVLGAVSVASGKRVIAAQPLVLPQRVFSGKRIFTTDRANHPLEKYLYTNMGTLATPAANPRGYKIENTSPFTIDIWGNINFNVIK